MIRSKFFLSALLGLLLLGGVAQAQDKPDDKGTKEREKPAVGNKALDADALVAKLTKKYGAYKDFSATIKKKMLLGPMAINSTTTLKWKSKSKIRSETDQMVPMMGNIKIHVVNDGKKGYMCQTRGGQTTYSELEADSPMTLQADLLLISLLKGDVSSLKGQGLTMTAEEITEDGVAYERVILKSPVGLTMKYDFKKSDSAIVKSSTLMKLNMGGGNNNDPRAQMLKNGIKTTATYSDVKIDKGIEDSVFVFKAPEGAQKVDPSGMLGGGGMPGMGGGRRRAPKPKSKPVKPKKDNDEDF
jgi:outer membrane lipoprotein-sorting protein